VTEQVGLCGECLHARPITSGKGSTFWLCKRAESDARFAKYPRLPVRECPGWEPARGDRAQGHQR
jgi:hypothetical protein